MTRSHSAALAPILALCYPVLAHLSIELDSEALALAAMGVLTLAILLPGLIRRSSGAWAAALVAALGGWLLARAPLPHLPLYAPPVLVPAFMAWVFGRTLLAERTPLIAQLIEHMHEGLERAPPVEVWPYARRLTLGWTSLFTFIATVNFALALLARPDGLLLAGGVEPPTTVPLLWWSWFANGIDYALIAAFFAIEYAWRRFRFPDQPYRNVFDFFRRLAGAMPALMARQR